MDGSDRQQRTFENEKTPSSSGELVTMKQNTSSVFTPFFTEAGFSLVSCWTSTKLHHICCHEHMQRLTCLNRTRFSVATAYTTPLVDYCCCGETTKLTFDCSRCFISSSMTLDTLGTRSFRHPSTVPTAIRDLL